MVRVDASIDVRGTVCNFHKLDASTVRRIWQIVEPICESHMLDLLWLFRVNGCLLGGQNNGRKNRSDERLDIKGTRLKVAPVTRPTSLMNICTVCILTSVRSCIPSNTVHPHSKTASLAQDQEVIICRMWLKNPRVGQGMMPILLRCLWRVR